MRLTGNTRTVRGRFQSADPYEVSSYLVNPQSWNRYSYVLNDPIHNVDPLGLLEGVPGEVEADPCGVEPLPTQEPPTPKAACRVQGFDFNDDTGYITKGELSALAEVALGESGFRAFDQREIEAIVSTAINRRSYNVAWYFDHNRPHFGNSSNPAPTQILDVLALTGYDAYPLHLGQRKLDQAKALNNGVLAQDSYVCDQLIVAKRFVVWAGNSDPAEVFAAYPVTFFMRCHGERRATLETKAHTARLSSGMATLILRPFDKSNRIAVYNSFRR